MAKGTNYGYEANEFVDPQTGAEIVQLTSNPTMSMNLYFENCNFTQDSKSVIFFSRRSSQRGAPWDLFRVDLDGKNLIQLTDCDDLNWSVMSNDGTEAFISAGKELRSVNLATNAERVLALFDDAVSVSNVAAGGRYVFARVGEGPDKGRIIRCDTDGSNLITIGYGPRFNHLTASRTGNYLAWINNSEINEYHAQTWYVMQADGSNNRRWAVQNWAHSAWVGATDRMQGTLLPPGHGIVWVSPEEDAPTTIASGPYFWHSSASLDAEWIVSDTNWPDVGLQLVHLPTGRYSTLCLSQSSTNGIAHPHPSISPDGTKVLFNSDRTGIPQVYAVTIPDWLKDELRTGKLLKRRRIGPQLI